LADAIGEIMPSLIIHPYLFCFGRVPQRRLRRTRSSDNGEDMDSKNSFSSFVLFACPRSGRQASFVVQHVISSLAATLS
jgi:hypothetical protein